MTILDELYHIGIVPVIKIEDAKDAEPLAAALIMGGLPAAEVTFRTGAAADAIRAMTAAFPDLLVGAGTVLSVEQAKTAVAAGARFIVSPGLNPDVVRWCQANGVPVVPGINDPTGIEQALCLGLKTVKFFPAEASGGVAMIKAMSAPYGDVTFMPTGGIGPDNLRDYLAFSKIIACGGSWMVKPDMIAAGDFAGVEKKVREAVDVMLNFTLAHVGVNCENADAAAGDAAKLAAAFGFAPDERTASVFAGPTVELMKAPGRGTMGHIGIRTPSVERAVYHLTRRGVAFDDVSAKRDKNGKLTFIYLKDEIGGFAYHLVQ